MDKYLVIKKIFEQNQNRENAISMSNYMKNNFEFYGIKAPLRKELYKQFINNEKSNKKVDWLFLDKCYKDNHREFQYLVYDYLIALKKYISYEDIPKIKEYILNKSWWDTIDFLCKVIGHIGLKDKRVEELMLKWSTDKNIWIKRTAIEYQLCLKDKINNEILEKILVNSFGTKEFFINKAIGWSLRDYSKTNPNWVKNFVKKYKNEMSSLSIKEASKYI